MMNKQTRKQLALYYIFLKRENLQDSDDLFKAFLRSKETIKFGGKEYEKLRPYATYKLDEMYGETTGEADTTLLSLQEIVTLHKVLAERNLAEYEPTLHITGELHEGEIWADFFFQEDGEYTKEIWYEDEDGERQRWDVFPFAVCGPLSFVKESIVNATIDIVEIIPVKEGNE